MNVLVIGIGGMIGDAIAASLRDEHELVVCVSRTVESGERDGLFFKQADRAQPGTVLDVIATHKIDIVIDVVAYDSVSTDQLLASLNGQVRQYVLLSSCDVYRNYGLLHRTESGAPDPEPLCEDSPLREVHFPYRKSNPRPPDDPQEWMDRYDKIPIESAVREIETDWTILRLPMVFGPGDRQRRFQWAIQPMLAGVDILELPTPWLNWTTTYGYIGNVAAAVTASVGNPNMLKSTFNVTDSKPARHSVWLERFAKMIDWKGRVLGTEASNHPLAQAVAALDLSVPLVISGRKLREKVPFSRPHCLDEAIEQTVKFERQVIPSS